MKSKVFEYLILLHKEEGASELVVDLTRVLAKNENEAQILAAREIPEKYLTELDNVELVIRPF